MATVSGGGLLNKALNRIANAVGRPVVRAGIFESAKYPDGTPVAQIAVYQEFGTPNARFPIQPRPFFRPVIKAGEKTWGPALGRSLRKHDYNGFVAMKDMGDVIAGELRQSVAKLQSPPLSEVTIMMRWMKRKNPNRPVSLRTVYEAIRLVKAGKKPGSVSRKPLVASGVMLRSFSYEVGSKWTGAETSSILTEGP